MWRRGARVVLLLALSLVTLTGWLALVLVAIDEGRTAGEGDIRWWVLGGAVVGAIVLLLLAVFFVGRLLAAAGVTKEHAPKRARRH